ncbi:rhodanese-like domain-containing protein [Flavivirga eckloniae]|uniref:Rhodanese-like domain-containing protein n=1 Tax=Flavivirga eckloniae TaxID=1803846 RepID=A0A2K9PUM0_9FLAO|nr:rhodanese-like domain-containing protein [Flavivirga eckloniae]AUP80237.1 rhodanese-like domain-containing protein [Flavivirga eckloniae]
MNKLLFYIFICFTASGFSQNKLKSLLKKHNKESIPYIYVKELKEQATLPILLDARESSEYKVSHLKNAIYVGYDNFKINTVKTKIPNKNAKIVVYCSLGIRSESIADSLKKAGYNNVENLYGGIFEWKNNNLPIYNSEEKVTDSIHAFSKTWGKWIKKGTKVYE